MNESNLELSRAEHALKNAKDLSKEKVNRLPGLIQGNGLLATLAFVSEEKEERKELKNAMEAVIDYLREREILNSSLNKENENKILITINELTNGDSLKLQQATIESLKYLSYLKRFSKKS
ncbi:type III-B CRISPR module-associated protein Cmr5 [Methylacidiphilum caldifontis]|uniref:CRISPR type III-B/RAMP module-associated protein Cmr5 n=1 Tax=Methylacidiphilum caldifontis TaxID=2795386 RepID=A0A4Y8P714_9BACT|nr:type III-B CRISPR module-associated protein Cmr5 [Methylacidiphilum caldifontis]TFE65871.1 type III-B CRISPR module-associated protein Cmr5 [Methylacidiphilum caldifontis]